MSNASLLGTPDIQLNPLVTCNPASGLGSHQYINPNCFAIPTAPGQNGPTILPAIYGPSFFNSDLALFKTFNISESKKIQFRIEWLQLPEPPTVVVQREEPQPELQWQPPAQLANRSSAR